MNGILIGIIALLCMGFVAAWLGWQLLRQNGRLLLRIEELEKRLDELEFGEREAPEGLPTGSEVPDFELPDLAGERKSLAGFRGQPLLLMFFNPTCGFCRDMMPKLAEVAAGFQPAVEGGILPPGKSSSSVESQESSNASARVEANSAGLEARLNGRQGCPPLLILTTGDAKENRQFFAEHEISCLVLLQSDGEVAKAYQAHGTPTGYLISAEGKIASPLAIGAEALLKLATEPCSSRGNEARTSSSQLSTLNAQPAEQSLLTSAATEGNGRASRFGNHSLVNSKLKRDGLKAGTLAPDFRLPRLDGKGELSLSDFRGRRVLLVFSSPGCGPCNALAPELEKFHREQTQHKVGRVAPRAPWDNQASENGAHGVTRPTIPLTPIVVLMISKGEPKENRQKVKEHGLTFPVVLQQQWEVSRRYAMFATPIAYLIDEAGIIANDVAAGADAILELMRHAARRRDSSPQLLLR